jgi:hydroxyacylglutathione hydrolase
MQITTLKALADNYIFLLTDDTQATAAVVDPGDAGPVLGHLGNCGCSLSAILITHHHGDHTGGTRELLEHFPKIPVYGGAGDRGHIPGQSHFLKEGDEISVCGAKARVLDVPGHTKAHIAYHFFEDNCGDLFSGDTVFGGTIGNLFEETPETMFQSIRKIRRLPPGTKIWCSHEYTLQYVRESAGIDIQNRDLAERLKRLEASAPSGKPTVPLTLEEECATNPFFRWDEPNLSRHLGKAAGLETFLHLCDIT